MPPRRTDLRTPGLPAAMTALLLTFAGAMLPAGPFPSASAAAPDRANAEIPAPVAALLTGLRSKDDGERLKAAKELGKLGAAAKSALPALENVAASDPDPDVRRVAARAFEEIRQADGATLVPALVAKLKDPDVAVRFKAVKDLAALGPAAKSALPALAEVARTDADEDVRRVAGSAREKIEPEAVRAEAAVTGLVAGLRSGDVGVRFKSARELGKLGAAAKPALPDLEAALKDADEDVRAVAARSLKAVKAAVVESSVQEQIVLLADKDAATRLAAAKDLEALAGAAKAALPALEKAAASDADEDVRKLAARAAAKIRAAQPPGESKSGTVVGEPLPAPAARTVSDPAGLFGVEAESRAADHIAAIGKKGLAVVVETHAALPAGTATTDDLLADRVRNLGKGTLLILLVKTPGALRVRAVDAADRLPQANADELVALMLERLRKRDFDAALVDGLKYVAENVK